MEKYYVLELEQHEWIEVYYALDTKIDSVANGDFGNPDSKKNKKWVRVLRKTMEKVAEVVPL